MLLAVACDSPSIRQLVFHPAADRTRWYHCHRVTKICTYPSGRGTAPCHPAGWTFRKKMACCCRGALLGQPGTVGENRRVRTFLGKTVLILVGGLIGINRVTTINNG